MKHNTANKKSFQVKPAVSKDMAEARSNTTTPSSVAECNCTILSVTSPGSQAGAACAEHDQPPPAQTYIKLHKLAASWFRQTLFLSLWGTAKIMWFSAEERSVRVWEHVMGKRKWGGFWDTKYQAAVLNKRRSLI